MKNILFKMDKLLRSYLGIEQSEVTPQIIKKYGKNLILLGTESFKRHANKISISNIDLAAMNQSNKKKLGTALGKAIASHLVISFDEISIKRDNINA